jgi:type IV pilus assembly protein PilF
MSLPGPTSADFLIRLAALSLTLALCACVTKTSGAKQPQKPDLPAAARINTELGWDYVGQGRLDVAEMKLKKAIEQDDSVAQAHSGLAYVYWRKGDTESAQTEFARAIGLDGDDPEIRNNYGAFLCDQHQYAEGDRNFMLALKNREYTTPAKAWNNAGVCAHQAGDKDRAEADFRHALQIDANYYPALAEMASLSYELQNYLGARAFLDRYQKVGPETPALLLLGCKTEQALGDDNAAHDYSIKLLRSYPDSNEAAQLLKLRSSAQ